MTRETYRKYHNRVWFTTTNAFYPTKVVDFYEKVVLDPTTREMWITYGNNIHTMMKEVISRVVGIEGYFVQEQAPKGSLLFQDWFHEAVPGRQYHEAYVKYGGMGKNHVPVQIWMNTNVIPGFNILNKRQA